MEVICAHILCIHFKLIFSIFLIELIKWSYTKNSINMIMYYFIVYFVGGKERLMWWLDLRKRKKYKDEMSLRAST